MRQQPGFNLILIIPLLKYPLADIIRDMLELHPITHPIKERYFLEQINDGYGQIQGLLLPVLDEVEEGPGEVDDVEALF